MVNVILALVALGIAALYGLGIAAIPQMMFGDVLGPTAYPRLLMILLIGVAGLLLVEGMREKSWAPARANLRAFLREDALTFVLAAGAVLAFFLLFRPLGYLLSTLLFLLVSMLVLYRGPRWIPVAVTLGFCGASYLIFVHAFGTQLPRGLLPF
ncbi:tripartite tricarboxylate transporter TctB family protein [Xinfangfangia pollutisoli]|uniref:tripartite tricarboxylate transporter TctB family protein n=1 Tax=Xinfangfangia pollutisoli TaxID=2865960 RepID=UPI001CD5C097|nr:tripartite tricarboxylate transporter TctB family protein [Xinfangfangia pollutisoli]